MRGNTEIIALLVSLIVELTRGDMSYNVISREDPCISLCEKAPATFANVRVRFPSTLNRTLHFISCIILSPNIILRDFKLYPNFISYSNLIVFCLALSYSLILHLFVIQLINLF